MMSKHPLTHTLIQLEGLQLKVYTSSMQRARVHSRFTAKYQQSAMVAFCSYSFLLYIPNDLYCMPYGGYYLGGVVIDYSIVRFIATL